MRKVYLIVSVVALMGLSRPVWSQNKNLDPECVKYLSFYQEEYKAKDYDRAIVNWRKAFANCPANASQNFYVHGTTMYTRMRQAEKDPAVRESLVDTILMLQDRRMAAFPKKRDDILNNKGGYIVNYKSQDKDYLYRNLLPIVEELNGKASITVLVNLFNSSLALYKKDGLSQEEVLNTYSLVSEALESKQPKDDKDADEIGKAQVAIGSLIAESNLASCETVINSFSSRIEADPENAGLLWNALRLMNMTEGCTNNELYFKAVTTLHRLDPSYKSAYALYRMNASRDNVQEAVRYLEEAISNEGSDEVTDAKYLYELSVFAYKKGLRSKALDAAKRTIDLNKGYVAESYIVIGNLWSSVPADGEIERYARFWVASDYYQKAKAASQSQETTDEASRLLGNVTRYFPEASEVFMYDLTAGQSYSVSLGGMYASTSVKVK